MITIIKCLTLWFYPDRCSLDELADRLRRRKKAASWWDHTHLTRRLATHKDAEEYKKLPSDKRHVLLQAARFSARYYSLAALPILALAMALMIPTMLKLADSQGVAVEVQMWIVTGFSLVFIFFGFSDLYTTNKSVAHAQTWLSVFEDVEKELSLPPPRPPWWKRIPKVGKN